MRKGIAISPGIAIGAAYCIEAIYVNPDHAKLSEQEVPAELARLDAAIESVAGDLRKLQSRVNYQLGKEAAAVFAVHESILRDPAMAQRIQDMGAVPDPTTPEQYATFIRAEIAKWREVARAANVRLEG